MWKDKVGTGETGSHDGVRERDGRLQLDQGNVVTADEPRVRLGVKLRGLYSRLLIYRMKNAFQSSCTMMSAVPMYPAPSSAATRLCLPRATLYCLPELLGARRKLGV